MLCQTVQSDHNSASFFPPIIYITTFFSSLTIHFREFIHRDICKPDNFLLGLGNKSHTIHPIDFGLTRTTFSTDEEKLGRYRDSLFHNKTQSFRPRFVPRLSSCPFSLSYVQSRRVGNDFYSLAHLLICLARGSLPWNNIGGEGRHRPHGSFNDRREQRGSDESFHINSKHLPAIALISRSMKNLIIICYV